jgi:hypothetical protein
MDTEMRLHYIEIERSSEAARMLRIADARAHLPGRVGASAFRLDTLSRAVVMLRKGNWARRDPQTASSQAGGTDVRQPL